MSLQEQQDTKEKYFNEAMRYMDNAKEYLKNAQKDGNVYRDIKYVRTACGTAYNGFLIALDCFLVLKDIHKPKGKDRKSIEHYQKHLGSQNKKMLDSLNIAYKILHLWGYYDGIESVTVVKEGFDYAYSLIDKIKPSGLNGATKRNSTKSMTTAK